MVAANSRRTWIARTGVGAAALTIALTPDAASGFRTAADLPEFEGQAVVARETPVIDFELNGPVPPNLDETLVKVELERAIAIWSSPGCTTLMPGQVLTSSQDARPGDGRNSIQWISDWRARKLPKDSPGATDVQYVKESGGRWSIIEADIYLNSSFDWTTGVPVDERKSVQAVLTHEVGHALGMLHPCELDGTDGAPECSDSDAFAVTEMYPAYSPDQISLADDDVAGVCFLYAAGCNSATCPDDTRCVAGTCQPLCGGALCPPDTACSGNQCVAIGCGTGSCLGESCSRDAHCALHEFCASGLCTRGPQPLGDPCNTTRDCADGACFEGACAEACAANTCRGGAPCDVDNGICVAELAPMGASCDFSTDCIGGHCAGEGAADAVCTRACGESEPPCPSGWACRQANQERVCAPDRPSSSGCAFAPPLRSTAYFLELLTSLGFVFWRAQRRRRTSR
jgi:hypothetical protein